MVWGHLSAPMCAIGWVLGTPFQGWVRAQPLVPFLVGFLMARDPVWALVSLVPTVFLGAFYLGPLFAVALGLAKLRSRATASAVLQLMISIVGAGVGPQLIGMSNDLIAPTVGKEAVRYSLLIVAVTNSWGALHALAASRTLRADLARVAQAERDA